MGKWHVEEGATLSGQSRQYVSLGSEKETSEDVKKFQNAFQMCPIPVGKARLIMTLSLQFWHKEEGFGAIL